MPPKRSKSATAAAPAAIVAVPADAIVDDAPKAKSRRTESATGSKASQAAAVGSVAVAANVNELLAKAFEQLMFYESKDGNRWAGKTYNHVVALLRARKGPIKSGSELANHDGVGKASVEKIDEFLKSGKIEKLDKLKELHGPLPASLLLGAASPGVKSGASKKGAVAAAADPATAAAAPPVPISAANKAAIKKKVEEFDSLTIPALKEHLRRNRQLLAGTKDELVERCASGVVLGALPVCPLCGAGKLRFDGKKLLYTCPGYMDDVTFQPCFYKSHQVPRTPWIAA